MLKVELDLEDAKKLLAGYEKSFNDLCEKHGYSGVRRRTAAMCRLAEAIYKAEYPKIGEQKIINTIAPDTLGE